MWKYHKRNKYWYRESSKSQEALYLIPPTQNLKKKWLVRATRYTRKSPSGKGTDHVFNTKKQAINFIKKRTKL